VRDESRWFLVEALANARTEAGVGDDYESKQRQLSHFAGVLAGFRYLGEITQDEEHTWYRKMLIALGYEPPEPGPPGTAQFIYTGDPKKRPPRIEVPEAHRRFVRSIPGPDEEFEVHGGRLRVVTVEIYDTSLVIRWRTAPQPDLWSAFPAEAAALAQDSEGLEDWAAEELRRKAEQQMAMRRLYKFSLSDDVGTNYVQEGSSAGGGASERTGDARFNPPPPLTATALKVSWLGLEVPIPLA
jgi:hypothetical protein